MSTTHKAFTLIELVVAIAISSVLVATTVQVYTLFRKAVIQDQSRSDLNQNARVALDRLTRELRLTPELLTQFPATTSDNSIAEPNQVEFEDGSANAVAFTYHRYYLSGSTLELDTKQYYFSSQPNVFVDAASLDSSGHSPIAQVTSTQAIAQGVSLFSLYGHKPLLIYITTSDNFGQTYPLRSMATGRNI